MTQTQKPLLWIRDLGKSYAAPVLQSFDFDLVPGEVHALVGANGAGKSTLAKIIAGLVQPDAGVMRISGTPYLPATKAAAERHGVQMVMQELNLIETLTIAENLFLNRLPRRLGLIDDARLGEEAASLLAAVGLNDFDPFVLVEELGVGEQQLVEIAAALGRSCGLLILDEPTAALTGPQTELLFQHIRRLKQKGVGILYISHRMEEIRRIADRVTILRDGRKVATLPSAQVEVAELVRLMVGQAFREEAEQSTRTAGPPALRVRHLCRGDRVRDVSFELNCGEVFGFAGLIGSGRTETMRAIFGADRADSGEIVVGDDGLRFKTMHPDKAVAAGIGMVPEDRKGQGLLLPQSIRSNVTLASLPSLVRRFGWMDLKRELETTDRLVNRLDVRRDSIEQRVEELSGGNQQKVVIARWLLRDCRILLFDEPTRGIDVASKRTVYRLLDDLARSGKAIILVSSELEELMAVCDRIGVMSAGRLTAVFHRGEWTQERIMTAAFSGYLGRVSAPFSAKEAKS